MGSYEIQWKKSAISDLYKIDKRFFNRIIKAVETLATSPSTQKSKKLHGAKHIYRLRVGNYRIVYEVNIAAKIITVYHVRHRKDIYRRKTH